jgi:hypothetical protein
MAYTDLKRGSGKQNMGGLLTRAYAIPLVDVDPAALPDLTAVGKLTIVGNIVPKAGKGFYELYSTPEKNKIDDTTVGEIDGKSKEHMYEFFFPGSEPECDEFEAQAMNDQWVLVIPDTRGRKRIIGLCRLDPASVELSADLPAYLIGSSGTTGAARADLAGKTFQFQAKAAHAPLYYSGTTPLASAV